MANWEKSATGHEIHNTSETSSDADARELAAIGKKSVLRVRFHPSSNVSTLPSSFPRFPFAKADTHLSAISPQPPSSASPAP
jgi:hypothetical protein